MWSRYAIAILNGEHTVQFSTVEAGGVAPDWCMEELSFLFHCTPEALNSLEIQVWNDNLVLDEMIAQGYVELSVDGDLGTHKHECRLAPQGALGVTVSVEPQGGGAGRAAVAELEEPEVFADTEAEEEL
jgi:hypothetical protein